MVQGLTVATVLVNLVAMIGSLWIGLYIVTRSVRRPVAWLSATMVWLLAIWFLFNVVRVREDDPDIWYALSLSVHAVQFAIPVLFHLTYLMRYEASPPRRFIHYLNLAIIVMSYVVVAVLVQDYVRFMYNQPRLAEETWRLNFITALRPTSYVVFCVLLVVLPLLSLLNLYRARQARQSPRLQQQLSFVMWAVAIAYVGALSAGLGIYFQLNMPTLPSVSVLAAGIVCLGYAVARYHAMLEGRPLARDTLYSLLGLALVITIYGSLTLFLFFGQHATLNTVAFILACAIITHTLFDAGRVLQERLLYKGRYRKLRADLRLLSMEAGDESDLGMQLHRVLRRLLHDLRVQEGFIALRQDDTYVVEAAVGRQWSAQRFPLTILSADMTKEIEVTNGNVLAKMALLVPIYENQEQVASLVLGAKADQQAYDAKECDRLNMLAHDIEDVIHITQEQDKQVQVLDRQLDEFRAREQALQQQLQEIMSSPAIADVPSHDEMSILVEDALQHLDDYGYLGEHQLANLRVVDRMVLSASESDSDKGTTITHVDKGKALQRVLIQTVRLLRPNGDEPKLTAVPPREWQPFVILHDYYVQGELIRDITNRLYISERTYHRRRRSGILSVAKSLTEMEKQA